MAVAEAFSSFVQTVDGLIRELREPAETVLAIAPHLRRLVLQRDWLDERYCRAIPAKPYAQYLLYLPPDAAFSIVSFVWNPSQGSPVHDHGTWGVIGQYEGEEEEARFRVGDHGLERLASVTSRPGDVSHVFPPGRDIHQIHNRTATPTISIHIYGGDIGTRERRVYDPDSGLARPFVSGYDAISPALL